GDLPKSFKSSRYFFQRKLLPGYGKRQSGDKSLKLPVRLYKAFLIYQSTLNSKEEFARQINELPDDSPIIARELTRILQNLTTRVTADFASISQLKWVEEVMIFAGPESELSITLTLSNKKKVEPTQVLSEAALDLLALLILVEVHIECAGL